MPSVYPVVGELASIDLELEKLFLDPNNPRFSTYDGVEISNDKIADAAIQADTQLKLYKKFSVDNLVTNIKANGYLPIDRVIVKKIAEDQYLVLEGNRRICAAKYVIQENMKNSESTTPEVISTLKKIPCLLYLGSDQNASWIFQGLRHIIGIHEWSAFNKAKLLVDTMEIEGLSLTEVGERFGVSAFGPGQWVRGYYAYKQAKEESDYSKEVDERAFSYFQELFNRSNPPLREWLEWSETDNKFDNGLNFNEVLSWLYPRNRDGDGKEEGFGDWNKKYIDSAQGLRILSFLIRSYRQQFEEFRHDLNLDKAYSIALQKKYEEEYSKNKNPIEELHNALDICIKSLENVPYKLMKDPTEKAKLMEKLSKINSITTELQQ